MYFSLYKKEQSALQQYFLLKYNCLWHVTCYKHTLTGDVACVEGSGARGRGRIVGVEVEGGMEGEVDGRWLLRCDTRSKEVDDKGVQRGGEIILLCI